jgi:hypothetical protein
MFIGVTLDCGKDAPTGRRIAGHCNKREIAFMGCNSRVRIAQAILEVGE